MSWKARVARVKGTVNRIPQFQIFALLICVSIVASVLAYSRVHNRIERAIQRIDDWERRSGRISDAHAGIIDPQASEDDGETQRMGYLLRKVWGIQHKIYQFDFKIEELTSQLRVMAKLIAKYKPEEDYEAINSKVKVMQHLMSRIPDLIEKVGEETSEKTKQLSQEMKQLQAKIDDHMRNSHGYLPREDADIESKGENGAIHVRDSNPLTTFEDDPSPLRPGLDMKVHQPSDLPQEPHPKVEESVFSLSAKNTEESEDKGNRDEDIDDKEGVCPSRSTGLPLREYNALMDTGEVYLQMKEYQLAVNCFHLAEKSKLVSLRTRS